jgi:hypothetical protein
MRADASLNGQELGGDVVDARRDGPLVSLGRKQCVQPSARSCRAARDPQVVVDCQNDRSEVRPMLSRRVYEGSCLAVTKRGGRGEEPGVGGAERATGVVTLQVEESPATELVGEYRRGHVADSVSAQHVAPHQAADYRLTNGHGRGPAAPRCSPLSVA